MCMITCACLHTFSDMHHSPHPRVCSHTCSHVCSYIAPLHICSCVCSYTHVHAYTLTHIGSHARNYMYTWLAKSLEVYVSDGCAFPLLAYNSSLKGLKTLWPKASGITPWLKTCAAPGWRDSVGFTAPHLVFSRVFLYSSLFHNECAAFSVLKDAHSLLDEALLPVIGEGKDLSHTSCPGVAPYQSKWAHGLACLGPGSSIKHQQTPLSHHILQLTGLGDPPRLVSVRGEPQEKAS